MATAEKDQALPELRANEIMMVATKTTSYGRRKLRAGETFAARKSDVKALEMMRIGQVYNTREMKAAKPQTAAATPEAPKPVDLASTVPAPAPAQAPVPAPAPAPVPVPAPAPAPAADAQASPVDAMTIKTKKTGKTE